jgi:hypothetical protein
MPESTLEVLIRATVSGLGDVTALKAEMSGLGGSIGGVNVAAKEHAKATGEAAAAERDLAKEGSSAARAMSELGEKGGAVFERFSSLAGTMSSAGPMGLAIGGALVGFGALIEGGRKVDETYRQQESSLANLKQATDGQHQSFEDLNSSFERFLDDNASYVKDGNEARDALAMFVRAGDDAKVSMDDLGLALDLSIGKHIELKEAAHDVIVAEQGQGRALMDLGINLASLKQSDENAAKAHKEYEAATKGVETAQKDLASAESNLKLVEDELSGKHKQTAADADKLAAAHQRVNDATAKLSEATDKQKTAQDNLNKSASTASQVHADLHGKLDGLRDSEDKQTQATDRLGHQWEVFASHTGPLVEGTFNSFIDLLAEILSGTNAAIDAINRFSASAEAANARAGVTPPGPTSHLRQHGGSVLPGQSYTVGEAGPETLVMGSSGGFVIPGVGGGMDDTNELLGQAVTLLAQVAANTRGPTFPTAAYGR